MNIDMDGSNRVNDRTFRVNFSGDGASKLREKVTDKLKEYMGDYTDDTLVEYVIVLLRNGRHKKEAENELNVFLGDDTDSFVTWLWDHLSSNLHLYVQTHESFPDEAVKAKPILEAHAGGRDGTQQFDSESGREKSTTDSRSRRHREWKGLVRDVAEPPPLRSSEIENFHLEEKIPYKSALVERSCSPQPPVQRKRNRQEDQLQLKREVISHPTIGAPRRLLQNAVRDAVGTLRSSSLRSEPALKRLRSVVSTSTEESSLDDRPQRIRSVARIPSAMTTAIKAAAEAAEDAIKVRFSGNVFDRLGCTTDVTGMTNNVSALRAPNTEDMCEDFDQMPGLTHLDYTHRSEYIGESAQNMGMLDRDTDLAFDSASDNDGYDGVNVVGNRAMDACQTSTSGGKNSDSLMVQYSVAKNRDEILRKSRLKDQDPPTTLGNTSHKIVNISVNVNTWKPPHYQASREVTELENRKGFQESEEGKGNPGVQPMKNDNIVIAGDQNEIPAATQRESQKTHLSIHGSNSAARPSEDADSRTVFVNNVHFAATKDSLSRHFNKFGEVLKVVILTDAATGQPKGSAYVEFMRKEAAELALSLNGASFMSRILKVVKRGSSSLQQVAPTMTWPRMARVSPFGARLPRVPFSRGMPGAFRARLPIKPGARSLQWKRDGNEITVNTQNSPAIASSNNVPTPSPRSLTYVRTELKQDGNSAPA